MQSVLGGHNQWGTGGAMQLHWVAAMGPSGLHSDLDQREGVLPLCLFSAVLLSPISGFPALLLASQEPRPPPLLAQHKWQSKYCPA